MIKMMTDQDKINCLCRCREGAIANYDDVPGAERDNHYWQALIYSVDHNLPVKFKVDKLGEMVAIGIHDEADHAVNEAKANKQTFFDRFILFELNPATGNYEDAQ